MIAKGASRSGARQLAVYLMRVERWDTGEPAELLELRSPWAAGVEALDRHKTADQLIEAFRDWQTLVEGTKQGRDGLYHAEISPEAHYAREMTPEQWKRAADILGEELGLKDQPCALVLHAGKDDRPHLHVVWQRTDVDTMKVVSDSYNYVAHERASMRMEMEFGQDFIPGKHAKRDREKQPEFPRAGADQDDHQQADRLDMSVKERKEQITALRQQADSAEAFKAALEDAGYVLARGDRRGIVLVDADGEVFSLSKQVTDIKGKEYKAFVAPLDEKSLPTVEEARVQVEARKVEVAPEAQKQGVEASKFLTPESPTAPVQPTPAPEDPEIAIIKKALSERQETEARKWADFHAQELTQLTFELDKQKTDNLALRDADDKQQVDALKAAIRDRYTGIKGVIEAVQSRWNPEAGADKAKARRREISQMTRRLAKERQGYEALLDSVRQEAIDNLKERQAQQRRDADERHGVELDRYIREHEDAKRILADIEAQRRELEKNDSLRDGPPPPTLGKR